ncbi:protein of unknown function (DU1801) [Lishizhenia tianjinensis]|uniref:YdhG-like domain-containing protein n=1 Tax=Lishizhenia tianjinensis TaxID=477690 RepID=A0A1I6YQI2_9FLAO|nr:DUF1801 domain-containing protein [Lishizhenia tianjinensis]SFT52727.1 protein of unknown function (DU1801) [Lishizhenia tianjinensis]
MSIEEYISSLNVQDQKICQKLTNLINEHLPATEQKIWHAHPVWFIDGNPIVGFSKLKMGIRLLFWSGQSFENTPLIAQGKFKAAELTFTHVQQIDESRLIHCLQQAKDIQWDYKNIVKRKGELVRLK